ncbi:hypothetical protein LCGC14_1527000 [marine sediment metagenome]|uniref:Uncharacterized protein n=1 Tax=marine sediment metagenome TaxID=412755 RepID=A0A0F9JHW2_9ZZZZ
MADKKEQIAELYKELYEIPENKRYALGSKGVKIINKIHKLKCEEGN